MLVLQNGYHGLNLWSEVSPLLCGLESQV